MAKDPVCGMHVTPEKAADQKTYMGKTYYFCTRKCKSDFEKNPERYLTDYESKIGFAREIAVVGTGQVGATFAAPKMTSSSFFPRSSGRPMKSSNARGTPILPLPSG